MKQEDNFDTPATAGMGATRGAEYDRILEEYKKVIQELKLRCVNKYGNHAVEWFGI